MSSTATYKGSEYRVEVETLAKGRKITVFRDGEVYLTTSTKVDAYTVINLQGWDHRDHVGIRFGRVAKPLGSKIEYGCVVGHLPLV